MLRHRLVAHLLPLWAVVVVFASLTPPVPAAAQVSIDEIRSAAEDGDSLAALQLGAALATGSGVSVDGSEAVRWLEAAAASSGRVAAVAAGWLGVVYERGLGVPVNGDLAIQWHLRAVDLGEGAAAQNLSALYAEGKFVDKNQRAAREWSARAAELFEAEAASGDLASAYRAAVIYNEGIAVPRDPEKAVTLLEQAVTDGNADAIALLAEIRAEQGSGGWPTSTDELTGGYFTFLQNCPDGLEGLFRASQEVPYDIRANIPRASYLLEQEELGSIGV